MLVFLETFACVLNEWLQMRKSNRVVVPWKCHSTKHYIKLRMQRIVKVCETWYIFALYCLQSKLQMWRNMCLTFFWWWRWQPHMWRRWLFRWSCWFHTVIVISYFILAWWRNNLKTKSSCFFLKVIVNQR